MKASLKMKWNNDAEYPAWNAAHGWPFCFCCCHVMDFYEFPEGIPERIWLVVSEKPMPEANEIIRTSDGYYRVRHDDGTQHSTGCSRWLREQYDKGARYIRVEYTGPFAKKRGKHHES